MGEAQKHPVGFRCELAQWFELFAPNEWLEPMRRRQRQTFIPVDTELGKKNTKTEQKEPPRPGENKPAGGGRSARKARRPPEVRP